MTLNVNGDELGTLPFPDLSNAGETEWSAQAAEIDLEAGANTIALTAPDAVGPNVDYLRVSANPIVAFDPDYVAVDGELRLELEQTADNSTRIVNPSTVDFFFTVAEDGVYALDLASNAGAPDGQGLTLFLNGEEIGDEAFPGTGDAGEETAFVELTGGTEYQLRVVSDAPGAGALDYLDVRAVTGDADADIAVQSQDPTYFDDRLHFSYLDDPTGAASTARDFKSTADVTISNVGTASLNFLDAEITSFAKAGATIGDAFQLQDPSAFDDLTLATGETATVTVLFDGAEVSGLGNLENGVVSGVLSLATNDAEDPLVTVDLAGFWQAQDEGGNEPNPTALIVVRPSSS